MRSDLGKALEGDPPGTGGDPRARSVFHQKLLPYLVRDGASSLSDFKRRPLMLWEQPLGEAEIADVMESARRRGLVEPLDQSKDAYGVAVDEIEWAPTDRGRELKQPRGLTIKDFFNYLVEALPGGKAVATTAVSAAGVLLTLPVLASLFNEHQARHASSDADARPYVIAGAAVVLFMVGVMLWRGMQGDANLRHAARAWRQPIEDGRGSAFYDWQTNSLRPWLGLAATCLVAAGVAVSLTHAPSWIGPAAYLVGIGLWGVLATST
jgi:hypothetical protein